MYRIRFAPYLTNYPSSAGKFHQLDCYRVYSNDIDMIYRFLQQHNFDPNTSTIENLSSKEVTDTEDDIDVHMLTVFKLQSNEDHMIHDVVTSNKLFELAIDYVVNQLGTFLLFGPTIMRRDIQVIDIIAHCLDTIPCSTIMDYSLLDGDSLNMMCDTSWMCVKKTVEQLTNAPDYDAFDLSYLSDLITNECTSDIMSITVEAYVSAFVEYTLTEELYE